MIRKKKLSLSRETVRVLGAGPLSKIAGGWPTGSQVGNDGQCTGKHSTCIMATGPSCDGTCVTDDCNPTGGGGSGGMMNCC